MRKIYNAANLAEAYLVAQRLSHAGIETRVLNQHAHGGLGEIPFTHAYPEIWLVDEADRPRAEALLAEYERAGVSAGSHSCPACGEENPNSFELCWRCGALIETPSALAR